MQPRLPVPIKVPISGIRMSRFGQAAAQRPCAKAQAAWRCRFALRAPSLVRRPPDAGPTNPRSRRTRALALRPRTMKQTGVTKNLECYKTIRLSPGCSKGAPIKPLLHPSPTWWATFTCWARAPSEAALAARWLAQALGVGGVESFVGVWEDTPYPILHQFHTDQARATHE